MYSAEQRKKAIETFARFGCSEADTIAELGYPNRNTLRNWWKEYQVGGDEFLERGHRRPRCSEEEKQDAVDYYLEHGKSLAWTIRAMGYASSGSSLSTVGGKPWLRARRGSLSTGAPTTPMPCHGGRIATASNITGRSSTKSGESATMRKPTKATFFIPSAHYS